MEHPNKSNLSVTEASCLLTFFDRFKHEYNKNPVLFFSDANIFEIAFIQKSWNTIKSSLNKLGLDFAKIKLEDKLACVITQNAHVISHEQLQDTIKKLEKVISESNAYDMTLIADKVMKAAIEFFTHCQPQNKDSFAKIIWEPNCISGEELLVELETGWGSGGYQINWPNANIFTEKHFERYQPKTGHRRRYRDWAFQNLIWLPHEALHCFDNANRQNTHKTKDHYWQAEYMPSSMQINLLHIIADKYQHMFSDIFHSAWFEEVLLWFWEHTHFHHQRDKVAEEFAPDLFAKWRLNSFSSPHHLEPSQVDEISHDLYDYTLGRLAIECYDHKNPEGRFLEFTKQFPIAVSKIKEPNSLEWPPSNFLPANEHYFESFNTKVGNNHKFTEDQNISLDKLKWSH